MKIPPSFNFGAPAANDGSLNSFFQSLLNLWTQLATAFNGNVSFGDGTTADNISGVWITVITPNTPNTDFVITHNLGRVPVGYLVMNKSAACDVYNGSTPGTITQLTLKATTGSVSIKIFVF